MTLDPRACVLYFPERRKGPKRALWEALGAQCGAVTTDPAALAALAADGLVPIVGCYPEIRDLVLAWEGEGRPYLYRDHGYFGRANAIRSAAGYYRWHWNRSQLGVIGDCPPDRLDALNLGVGRWRDGGSDIVIALPGHGYSAYHGLDSGWLRKTTTALRRHTKRAIRVRDKGSRTPLAQDLAGAHALVTHGSIAAVEAVALGCPVFVAPVSAAALVGSTDLAAIEAPATPARTRWLASLACSQFTDTEMLDGTLWAMLPPPPEGVPANGRSRSGPGRARPASSSAAAPA